MTERDVVEHLAPAAVDARQVTLLAVAVLLFLGAAMGILAWVFFTIVPGNRILEPARFPQPRLQAHPSTDLQHFLDKQRSELTRYRWANADHSLVAIPIDRAMEIISQRGSKGYEPIELPRPASPPHTETKP